MRLWDPLAIRELSALLQDPVFRGRGVPRGDGRPVLLIPGFLAGDWALRVLNSWLGRVGYRPYLSGIVLNIQHSERMLSGLRRKVVAIRKEAGSRVTLLGHSRGGLLAKVYSQRRPQDIEQVIALGAPLPIVPTTSIYTKADDVVNFRSCLRPDIPAMPVWGSHNGLVVNPEVFRLLGRLLARPARP